MALLAQDLAAEYELDFADVFGHQYVLRRGMNRDTPGMRCLSVAGWTVCVGRSLPCFAFTIPGDGAHLIFIGLGVDAYGNVLSKAYLQRRSEEYGSRRRLIGELNRCAGRFVYAILGEDEKRLYGDASASLASYYTPSMGLVGCSQLLALNQPVKPNKSYPGFANAILPGGSFHFTETADKRTKMLVANHYLDLDSWEQVRFWPTEEDDFTCPTTVEAIEDRVDFVIQRNRQVITALAKAMTPCYLPLSGGSDSRTLLAFAKPVHDKIEPFVHMMGFTSRHDAYVARRLARVYDLPLREIDAVKDPGVQLSPEAVEREHLHLGLCQGLILRAPERRKGLAETTLALPRGGVVLRGQIINISKGYHFTRPFIDEFKEHLGAQHRPWIGMKALGLEWETKEQKKRFKTQYTDWANSLPESAQRRTIDFALIEQHRTHSMGRFLNLFSRSLYMTPCCDRRVMHAMVSIPPHLRYHLYIHDMIFQQAAPELAKLPYHKMQRKYLEGFRHPDSLPEQLRKLPARV